jgi:hypothetical protein
MNLTMDNCSVSGDTYWYGITTTSTADVYAMWDVGQFLNEETERARKYAVTSFWPKDRKFWLSEYDRLVRLQKSFSDGQSKIRTLQEELAIERAPKAKVDGTPKKKRSRR